MFIIISNFSCSDTDGRELREKGLVDDIIFPIDTNPSPQPVINIENGTLLEHTRLRPEILKQNNEVKDDSFIKSSSTNPNTLSIGGSNHSRISKSTECLPQPSLMTSCMMLPAAMSLEDIACNNQRISMTDDNKSSSAFITSKLMKRLKGLRVTS